MKMFTRGTLEEMPIPQSGQYFKAPQIDGKTSCASEEGCEVLNEFLNGSPKPREYFPFSINSTKEHLYISINTSNMAPKEMMDLNLRLIKFLGNEINDVRNGD